MTEEECLPGMQKEYMEEVPGIMLLVMQTGYIFMTIAGITIKVEAIDITDNKKH